MNDRPSDAQGQANQVQDCARTLKDGSWYWIGKSFLYTHGKAVGVFGVAVYNCLACHAGSDQKCYPSQQRMAEMLGCSRAAVNKAIKALEKCGLIAVERRGRNPQIYRLLKLQCNSDKPLLPTSRDFDVTQVRTNDTYGTRIINDEAAPAEVVHNASCGGNLKMPIQGETLALELAESLNDRPNLSLYLSYCRKYPESQLRAAIREVFKTPASKIRKSRAALFGHLIKAYEKHD